MPVLGVSTQGASADRARMPGCQYWLAGARPKGASGGLGVFFDALIGYPDLRRTFCLGSNAVLSVPKNFALLPLASQVKKKHG